MAKRKTNSEEEYDYNIFLGEFDTEIEAALAHDDPLHVGLHEARKAFAGIEKESK
jgi:hypothetical protein